MQYCHWQFFSLHLDFLTARLLHLILPTFVSLRAMRESDERNIRAVFCLSTPPAQTAETSFQSRFRSSEAASLFRVRERECTGRPIRGLEKTFFLHHLFDDEYNLTNHSQSCFWLLKVCACVEVLLPCRRKCSRCHSFCFWQVGILGGGHSVCSTWCYLLQVVRASPTFTFCLVWTCVLFDPFAIRSPSLTFLWSYLLIEDVVDIVLLPDIDQECRFFHFS